MPIPGCASNQPDPDPGAEEVGPRGVPAQPSQPRGGAAGWLSNDLIWNVKVVEPRTVLFQTFVLASSILPILHSKIFVSGISGRSLGGD